MTRSPAAECPARMIRIVGAAIASDVGRAGSNPQPTDSLLMVCVTPDSYRLFLSAATPLSRHHSQRHPALSGLSPSYWANNRVPALGMPVLQRARLGHRGGRTRRAGRCIHRPLRRGTRHREGGQCSAPGGNNSQTHRATHRRSSQSIQPRVIGVPSAIDPAMDTSLSSLAWN